MESNYARPSTLALQHSRYWVSTIGTNVCNIHANDDGTVARVIGQVKTAQLVVDGGQTPAAHLVRDGIFLKYSMAISDERDIVIAKVHRRQALFSGMRYAVTIAGQSAPFLLRHEDEGKSGFWKWHSHHIKRKMGLLRGTQPVLTLIDRNTVMRRGLILHFHDGEDFRLDRRVGLFLAYLVLQTPYVLSLESVEHLDI